MSGGPELQLLVFDTRRGNAEGQEQDKLLAFFPPGLPPVQQSGLAGLLHGLLLFTSNFTGTPVSADLAGEVALLGTLPSAQAMSFPPGTRS